MMSLDLRTIVFIHLLVTLLSTLVITQLWLQNRSRVQGSGYWAADYALQALALVLVGLRGVIPDWLSIVVGNSVGLLGAALAYVGLCRFAGLATWGTQNYLLVAVFSVIHSYFAVIQPDLTARNINVASTLAIICGQCAYVALRRGPHVMLRESRVVGAVFLGYVVVSLARVVRYLYVPLETQDYFKAGGFESLAMTGLLLLAVLLTFAVALMYNGRILHDLRAQEEKFSKAFHSSPYGVLLSRISDGCILEANEGFFKMIGSTAREVLGRSALDLGLWLDPEERKRLIADVKEGKPVHQRQLQFCRKSGEPFAALLSSDLVPVGGEACLVSSIDDITERQRIDAALAEQLNELKRWYVASQGREGRVVELKREVNALLAEQQRPARYPAAADER